ncbi:MAG: methylenetetrahydrofolate reductase [Rhodospirillaceae bacterium]|nr:methylenetetrahydrofolate reductase [Rhodospirillaceae bacterium]
MTRDRRSVAYPAELQPLLQRLLTHMSTETLPDIDQVDKVCAHVPPGTRVFVASLPSRDRADTVAAAKILNDRGYVAVPHIAARALPSHAALEDFLYRLTGEAGCREALVIAGDRPDAAGPFAETMDVLLTGALERHGLQTIHVGAHPEGNRLIGDDALREAMLSKAHYAGSSDADFDFVTQFVFDGATVVDWAQKLRGLGIGLPVRLGIAGPADLATLLRYAKICGIGVSTRALMRQGAGSVKLIRRTVRPDDLLAGLVAAAGTDPLPEIAGLHIFPFGGVGRAMAWLAEAREAAGL